LGTSYRQIEVTEIPFVGAIKYGDFTWKVNQQSFGSAIFASNDNEEQFKAFMATKTASRDADSSSGTQLECAADGGNAKIRPNQSSPQPRGAGVPTGVNGAGCASLGLARRSCEHRSGDRQYCWAS
jgi:hypothetical protein